MMRLQAKSTWRASPPVLARGECTICQGTGWQLVSAYGSSHARRCSCGALHRVICLRQNVHIPPQYHHCSLDAYRPGNFSQTQALAEALRFAERFPRVEHGLLFVGGPNSGKTHLAVGIVLKLLQRFLEDILFLDFPGLGCPLQSGPSGETVASEDYDRAKNCSLLVLDNLSLAAGALDRLAEAARLLMARQRSGRITLITSGDFLSRRKENSGHAPRCNARGGEPMGGFVPLAVQLTSGFKILRLRAEPGEHERPGTFPLFHPRENGFCA